jgi:hypothetical protein
MIVYAFLGTSRVLSVSSTTTLAILVAAQLGWPCPMETTRVSALFGTSAATLESDVVWGILTANLAMAEGNALFHLNLRAIADEPYARASQLAPEGDCRCGSKARCLVAQSPSGAARALSTHANRRPR